MRVAVVLGCLFAACASQQGFINDKTVWIVATSDWKQGSAFFSALEDVRRDWYAVVGSRPVVVSELPEDTAPHVTENITSIVFGTPSSDFVKNASLPSKCKQGWESHCIVRISDPHFGGHRLIVTGADLRGSIFAAYTVSENLLGIGPLDFWLQIRHEMVRNVLIDNVSAAFPIFIPSPAFKYRAMFVNDEDLLGGLRNDPMRQSVWSIDTWDALYSTSLRLKANSVLPGTNIFPDNPAYSLAARRGLAFSSHHYNILGLSPVAQSVATWFPEAYNFQLRPDAMMWAWNASLQAWAKHPEVFWTIGYRGAGDEPAQCYGPCTLKDKAEHVSWALGNQSNLLRAFVPDGKKFTWLWDEGLAYLKSGALTIPNDTVVVFTDSGDGNVEGLEYAHGGAGIYTHVAMLNGKANQLTEMVPIARIFGSITNFVSKNATSLFVLNVSDLLPYVLGILANFRAIYSPELYSCNINATGDCDGKAASFIADFAVSTFHVDASDANTIAQVMLSYYNVSYIQSGNSDDLLAMLIRTTADCIGEEHLPPPQEPFDWRAAAKILCQEQTLLEKIYTNVPTDRKQAFKTTVYNSVAYHCYAVSALLAVQSALVEFRNANSPRALGNLSEAMSFLDAIDELHHDVEGIRFAGLFAYDDLTCQPAARRAVQSAISRLQSTIGVANFGWATGVDLTKCRGYSYMYNYQFDFARQHYPTQFATPDQNMFNWPQVYCDYIDSAATKDGSWCIPNPTGASFHLNATITIKTAGGIPVRYTMDGSAPGPSSPIASGTITLTESTTIIAQAIDAAQPPTVAIFEISS